MLRQAASQAWRLLTLQRGHLLPLPAQGAQLHTQRSLPEARARTEWSRARGDLSIGSATANTPTTACLQTVANTQTGASTAPRAPQLQQAARATGPNESCALTGDKSSIVT